jgi:hypothetical protein
LIYAEASAIVKRYYAERGSDLLKSRWVTIDRIFTSRVTCAAELRRPIEFWASDQRLEAAAKRERFTVVNLAA